MVTDLLLESATLMVIGMVSVFTFLLLLVLLMNAMSSLLRRYSPAKVANQGGKTESATQGVSPAVVAAISAAVHQYRQQHK
ncbi:MULTISPECIES: oxaloacetate decarboxylase subunit gamma [unclassified Arsukibacterium]|uniref:oxaloacetate decarboxylase subunit gamma n=1 Tax=unclassified Arsukibacterium TaxID=2635278 RepID=UPI000C94C02C|nr:MULTISPECIES: oxaloacetate decarboxylase subunit gamma [unclassified Arsukibacterium]MAA95226.1 oxaloacetate decarboxylase [Rheinheimera sp.]HAW92602.1 oxaloacetate decarboxylase [Candidatus Azambacteria bacterium]|tara:strand:+ start:19187 stop:19429 length:243 start_codon:yes stop_codon:yes gene_type:complete